MTKWVIILLILFPFSIKAQIITTFAGNGVSGVTGDGGYATMAKINNPQYGIFDRYGNYYFSQGSAGTIRKVDLAGVITTIVGPGTFGVLGDGGPATAASLRNPGGLAFDSLSNLYISDNQNWRVRKVDMVSGIITTFAGSGVPGDFGDGGQATAAKFVPTDICFDKHGNLYVSDNSYNKIRKINSTGVISTYAGTGMPGFGGDGGTATSAYLWQPEGIAIDNIGNLFIADGRNDRVRKIDTNYIISTVAGTGFPLYSGDGVPATNAQMVAGIVALDNYNNIYISDSNQRIRKVDAGGIIHTIVGTGIGGYNGDGILADTAEINSPGGISFDSCGNVYFVDMLNNRIRKITYSPTIPTISLAGTTTAPVGTTVTVNATVASAGSSYTIAWMNHGIEFTTTTVPTVTYTKPAGIDTITARIVPTGYGCYDSTTSAGHVVNTGTTGTSPGLSKGEGVFIYPNPAHGETVITAGSRINSVVIYNMVGQTTPCPFLKTGGGVWRVDVSGLPDGVYFVKVNGVYVERFVKE